MSGMRRDVYLSIHTINGPEACMCCCMCMQPPSGEGHMRPVLRAEKKDD